MSEDGDPKETVIQAMEDVASVYGFRESYARIYGTLYFQTAPTTMDELVDKTGFAKSTISDALNEMEKFHLVSSEKKKGHGKTKFYTAEEDLDEVMKKFMEDQVSNEVEIMLEALDEAKAQAEEGSPEQEKIEVLENFYQRSRKLMKLFKKLPKGEKLKQVTETIKDKLSTN